MADTATIIIDKPFNPFAGPPKGGHSFRLPRTGQVDLSVQGRIIAYNFDNSLLSRDGPIAYTMLQSDTGKVILHTLTVSRFDHRMVSAAARIFDDGESAATAIVGDVWGRTLLEAAGFPVPAEAV